METLRLNLQLCSVAQIRDLVFYLAESCSINLILHFGLEK